MSSPSVDASATGASRVVVIGAGKRVRGAVLPALWCLGEDRFRIEAVVARSVKEIPHPGGHVTTVDSMDRIDFRSVDLIVMAATIGQVPGLLADLAGREVGGAVLLLDTPVLPPAGLWASRFFPAFRRVLVSEDNIALPPFLLARRLIDSGAIGELERIYFFHNGFKHHALASLKLLSGSAIRRIINRKFTGKMRHKEIDFENGLSAVMYEPRDYATGKFLLKGSRGAIADYDYAVSPVHRIGYLTEGPIYRGLTLDGRPLPPEGLDADYLERVGTDIFDASPMNTMKLRGLMELLAAARQERSPFHYDPVEGVCDHLAIRLVDKVGYLPSPRRLRHLLPLARRLPHKQERAAQAPRM